LHHLQNLHKLLAIKICNVKSSKSCDQKSTFILGTCARTVDLVSMLTTSNNDKLQSSDGRRQGQTQDCAESVPHIVSSVGTVQLLVVLLPLTDVFRR